MPTQTSASHQSRISVRTHRAFTGGKDRKCCPAAGGSWDRDLAAPGAKAVPLGLMPLPELPGLASFFCREVAGGSVTSLLTGSKVATPGPGCTSSQVQMQTDTGLSLNSWEIAWSGTHPDPMNSPHGEGVRGVEPRGLR